MLEKGKISNRQAGWLLVNTILTTSILFLPSMIAREAKQDSWISIVAITLLGLLAALLITSLGKRYPRQSVIQYSRIILGKPLGTLVGLVFVLFFLYINSFVIREFSEFVLTLFLTKTPLVAVTIAIIFVSAYAVRSGLEVLARVNELILPIVLLMVILSLLLSLPDMDVHNLQPVLARGWFPVIKGAYPAAIFFAETSVMLMLIPFLKESKRATSAALKAVLVVGLFQLLVILGVTTQFGLEVARIKFPFLAMTRYISVFDIIERLEPTTMLVWVMGGFIKISVFFYCAVLSSAQLLNLKDYRPLVLPLAALLVLGSIVLWDNVLELSWQIARSIIPFFLSVEVGIPLLLLFLTRIRELRGRKI